MSESVIITVQMEVGSTQFYMATQGFAGSNFYHPFVQSLPTIEWSGEGFLKTQAGQMTLTNNPDNDDHPFAYSTNWNSLITDPDQQFLTSINPGEPEGAKSALWHGYSVVRNITENSIQFDLFELAKYTALDNQRLVGDYSVSSLTAGNPTILTIDNREMGGNTAEDWIKVGDLITVNNTFSPVIANTQYLVTAVSSNNVSIALDSSGATFATPRVVTNTFDSGSGTRCILNKILTVPYVAFATGASIREIPRDRFFQDGFFGHYFFTAFQNWYPSPGTNFKIFIDGVNETSNFTLVSKSYKRTDGANYDGTITVQTLSSDHTVFDMVDLLYSPCDKTKAPDSDDSVKAGIMVEYSEDTTVEDFLSDICKNTNHQFFVRYTSATDSALNSYLIERSNAPSATNLDNNEILKATYQFVNPVKAITTPFKTRNESGSLAGDNYQYLESEKSMAILNSDLPSGSIIQYSQMHDQTGQQLQYLLSILNIEKKMYLTVTLDNINTSILPGDNLNFTREVDKVTVNQLLVRKIIYDLNKQQTTFCGDGTITLLEKT